MRHCPYPSGLFNRIPQSGGFGLTSAGAYIFSGNVVLEALRVVSKGFRFLKPPALAVGLLTHNRRHKSRRPLLSSVVAAAGYERCCSIEQPST